MTSTLPPDPYKLLGVPKDAKLPEIRSAHRKLVLKCHPDKVQDADLKAIKQDEFQKVQQAYEILSDDTKRLQYDEQFKLFELRKEMGRGNPTPRSNPFEYEVKTAEPRPGSYARPPPRPPVYTHPTAAPRSHEDLYEEPLRHVPKKSSSYESTDRKRATRDEERAREASFRKYQEDERIRTKEKESKRSAHKEKKKSSDKEKRRGAEEKVRSRTTYVEDDSSDTDYRAPAPRASEKKSSRHKMEDEIRAREEHARAEAAQRESARAHPPIKEAPLDPKWRDHAEFAGKYMQAARRKVAPVAEDPPFHPPHLRRAETYAAPSPTQAYNIRFADPQQPQFSDDDAPRRSSAHKESRRSSETPPTRREKSRRRSPSYSKDAYIVEPPSPQAPPRKPTLQTHASAPPVFTREKPSRSKTQDYPRQETIPPLPRAQTFQAGDRDRGRERGGSKLKNAFVSTDSESEDPYTSPRHSHSPQRRAAPEPTRYVVENGRTVPIISRHRADLHNLNEQSYPRERSESPRGTPARHPERPPITRNPPSSERPHASPRAHTTSYFTPPEAPEPIVYDARPKLARETSSRSARPSTGAYFENVKYAPKYDTNNVIYANRPGALYDSGRRPSERGDYYIPRSGREGVYA